MPPSPHLPARYTNLFGEELLCALSEGGELPTLESFWRYGDAAVSASTADAMLISGSDYLVDLVVDELLEPTLGDPLPDALTDALQAHRPQLRSSTAQRLAEALRDEEPYAQPAYELARPLLEVWLIEQNGKLGEDLAIGAIAGETPNATDSSVRAAAFKRCRESPRVLKRAAEAVVASFGEDPAAAWTRGAELVEEGCDDGSAPPGPVVPIVKLLLRFAADHAPQTTLPPTLARFAAAVGIDELEDILQEGSIGQTAGAGALMGAVARAEPVSARTRLFVIAVRKQPHQWPALEPHLAEWSEADWRRALKGLVGDEEIDQAPLLYLLNNAPVTVMAEITRLALNQARDADPLQVLSKAGERLRQHLNELGTDATGPAWVRSVYWPPARDDEAVGRLYTLFSCLPGEDHARMVARGLIEEKIQAETAARLLPADDFGQVWSVSRALIDRAISAPRDLGYVVDKGSEPSVKGPHRVLLPRHLAAVRPCGAGWRVQPSTCATYAQSSWSSSCCSTAPARRARRYCKRSSRYSRTASRPSLIVLCGAPASIGRFPSGG